MTQKTKSRVVIDTNKHGIRRETDLDKLASKARKRKEYESNRRTKSRTPRNTKEN